MMDEYEGLKQAFDGYLAGRVTAEGLKTVAAPYGIYQQRNGRFMIRVRVNGGQIDCASLMGFADILAEVGGTLHLTSRQDIQLHEVPAGRVLDAVAASDGLGWPFKGGGGNTYRNTVVGADSGLSPEGAFDVYPYAGALDRAMRGCEKAYALPRKFKVGLFACERDLLKAAIHDLGFVAQVRGGRRGFRVYAGGGLGRESAVGVCLVAFLPAERLVQAAFALVALFHDHGDRENRHQARLRFLLKRLGPESFMRLFWEYYVTTEAPKVIADVPAVSSGLKADGKGLPSLPVLLASGSAVAERDAYEHWVSLAVSPTRFGDGLQSVRLFVPYGDLTACQLRGVARLAADAGSPSVRLLPSQDVLIPLVREEQLPGVYGRLRGELSDVDLTFRSYKGHIMTCVGAAVCKIGLVDARSVADRLAEALDRYLPAATQERQALQRLVADEVRISGCPNACSGHPAARLGIGCVNQKVDGQIVPHARIFSGAGVEGGVPRLSEDETGALYDVGALVQAAVLRLAELAGAGGLARRIEH